MKSEPTGQIEKTSQTQLSLWLDSVYRVLLLRKEHIGRFILRVGLISSVPVTVVIVMAVLRGQVHLEVQTLIPNWRLRHPHLNIGIGIADAILLTPLIETGLTFVPIWVFRRLRLQDYLIPLMCGLVWGLIHINYNGTSFGLVAAWPFFCYTVTLLAFEKTSLDRAWLIASAIHAINNVLGLAVSFGLAYYLS